MTKKENEIKKETTKKSPGQKLILFELVEAYPEHEDVKIGALSRAGLLDQYRYEQSVYEKEEIKPSLTVDEFTKILNDYLGE